MGWFSDLLMDAIFNDDETGREPIPMEEWDDERSMWHGSFTAMEDIYRAFDVDDLEYDSPLLFSPVNPDNEDLDEMFDSVSFSVSNEPDLYPRLIFDPHGRGICYGEFMDELRQAGEEYGWERLYQFKFGYYFGRKPIMWKSTPFWPIVERDPRTPNCFIISAEKWYDNGHKGIGGAAGL